MTKGVRKPALPAPEVRLIWAGHPVYKQGVLQAVRRGESSKLCLHSSECLPVNRKSRRQWCAEHMLFVDGRGDVFAKLLDMGETLYADCITGSLYNEHGECKSTIKLNMKHPWRLDQEQATRILMGKTFAEVGE